MVNLSQCDKCGNRNVMCFACNDNKHYREWKYSHDRTIRNIAIDEFAHQLKETFNQEFPSDYESTKQYFTLENARMIVDEIAEQLKGGSDDK